MSLPERHKTKENGEFVITSLRYRDSISINHQITTELDYSSFHPKMIYDLEGLDLSGDPYEGIGDLDRDHDHGPGLQCLHRDHQIDPIPLGHRSFSDGNWSSPTLS